MLEVFSNFVFMRVSEFNAKVFFKFLEISIESGNSTVNIPVKPTVYLVSSVPV